jgi:hypothetical protein
MLNKLKNAAMIALFACLVIGFGIAVWSASQHSYSPPQHKSATQKERGTDKHAIEERESPEEALARYTLWLVVFTGVLAVATIGLGVGTIGLYLAGEKQIAVAKETAEAAKKSAHVAQETLIASQRPWVSLDPIDGISITSPLTFDPARGARMRLRCIFRNTGNSPALSVRWTSKLIILSMTKLMGDEIF